MLSLSTAFNIKKHNSWNGVMAEALALGFNAVELNVEIPEKWLADIERSVQAGEIAVSSLHNYCPRLDPLPPGRTIYSGYFLTSDDEEERRNAVRFTERTIEWAGRLNAKAVVLHAGEIPTDPTGGEFFSYIRSFGRKGELFGKYRDALLSDREKKAPRYLELLRQGLDACLNAAARSNVMLALENRYYIHEMPNIEETLSLIGHFSGSPLRYWHDTGHAEVFVRLGFVKEHADFLKPLAPHLFGMHLHDIRNISDHYAPGAGDFDFSILAPHIKNAQVKVIEAHAHSSNDEVRKSIEFLKNKGVL